MNLYKRKFDGGGWIHIYIYWRWSFGASRYKELTSVDLGCISIDVWAKDIDD